MVTLVWPWGPLAALGVSKAACNHGMNITEADQIARGSLMSADENTHPFPQVGGLATTMKKSKYDILCLMVKEEHLEDNGNEDKDDETLRQPWSSVVSRASTRASPTWNVVSKAEAQEATYRFASAWDMPNKARNWLAADDMEKFIHERAKENSNFVVVAQSTSEMGKNVTVLERQMIPWANVKLSCHYWGPNESFCHMPVRHQVFLLARVLFEDGHENTLMFAEHNMEPGCKENCLMMNHVVETALVEDENMPSLFDNLRHTSMVSV